MSIKFIGEFFSPTLGRHLIIGVHTSTVYEIHDAHGTVSDHLVGLSLHELGTKDLDEVALDKISFAERSLLVNVFFQSECKRFSDAETRITRSGPHHRSGCFSLTIHVKPRSRNDWTEVSFFGVVPVDAEVRSIQEEDSTNDKASDGISSIE